MTKEQEAFYRECLTKGIVTISDSGVMHRDIIRTIKETAYGKKQAEKIHKAIDDGTFYDSFLD
jgi:hypothetical protein